jgi:hypothetical protein
MRCSPEVKESFMSESTGARYRAYEVKGPVKHDTLLFIDSIMYLYTRAHTQNR